MLQSQTIFGNYGIILYQKKKKGLKNVIIPTYPINLFFFYHVTLNTYIFFLFGLESLDSVQTRSSIYHKYCESKPD